MMAIQPDGKPSTVTLAMVREWTDKAIASERPDVPVTLNMLNHADALGFDLGGLAYASIYRAMAAFAPRPHSRDLQVESYINDMHATNDRAEAKIAALTAERDGWEKGAGQFHLNQQYYAGLVDQIGELLGPAAKTRDDGNYTGEVLRAKVVEVMVATLAAKDARIAELKSELAQRPAAFVDPLDEPMKPNPFREHPSDRRRIGA